MAKKCRYRKTGTVTVLEEYEGDSENDGEDAGWYTLATLHEPGENHTGERLVWALTGLDDLRAKLQQAQERVEMQRQNLSYAAQYGALWRTKAEAAEKELAKQRALAERAETKLRREKGRDAPVD